MDLLSLPNSVNILVVSNEFVVEIVKRERERERERETERRQMVHD